MLSAETWKMSAGPVIRFKVAQRAKVRALLEFSLMIRERNAAILRRNKTYGCNC